MSSMEEDKKSLNEPVQSAYESNAPVLSDMSLDPPATQATGDGTSVDGSFAVASGDDLEDPVALLLITAESSNHTIASG